MEDSKPHLDSAAEAEMKSAAKWLVATSGAVVAVVVAGVQVRDITGLSLGLTALAVLSIASSLGVVATYLALAARVLVAPRPTFADLRRVEAAERGVPPDRLVEPTDPLLRDLVVSRRLELLGPERHDLLALEEERSALSKFEFPGEEVTIAGRTLKPVVPADVTAATNRQTEVDNSVRLILEAASYWHTKRRYEVLLSAWSQIPLALLFLVGIVGFVLSTAQRPGPLTVDKPLPVNVTVPADGSGLPKACTGLTLDATAIGGTLEEPELVTAGAGACPPIRFTATRDYIVVPTVKPGE